MDFVIITAANDSYINTLIDFVMVNNIDITKLIIYDLGLNQINEGKIISLKNKHNFTLKKFDFDKYPEHVNLKKYYGLNCSYAFKPIIIYNEGNEAYNKNKVIIWMDSANRFNQNNIINIYNTTKKQGIYSPISANSTTIESVELNHHSIVNKYGLTRYEHCYKLKSISANLIGIDYSNQNGFNILNKWYEDSLDKNLIIPDGTNRNNNRQDQTLLSIIIYLYEKNNNIFFDYTNFGVKFWKKKVKSTIDDGCIPFKLIDRKHNRQLALIYCMDINEAILTYANRKNISTDNFLKNFSVTI
jgi:hypothetical protein